MIKATAETINNVKVLTVTVDGLVISPGMTVSLNEDECNEVAREFERVARELRNNG
jgi:hypothetical protein